MNTMNINKIHHREYAPYMPSIKAEEMAGAWRAVNDMLARSESTFKRSPTQYNKLIVKFWADRKAALSAF